MFSRSNPDDWPVKRALILAGIVVLSAGAYLLVSRFYYSVGFPLDDAWIHQTFARNLILFGEWAFILGQPSAGSTAPLWSALLALGFLFHLGPYIWTYFLGALLLWALSMVAEFILRSWIPSYRPRFPWAGAWMAIEWHLVWSSVSGMETLLSAILVMLVLAMLVSKRRLWFWVGALTGLSVWVRPDGITLLGPVLLTAILVESSWKRRVRALAVVVLGFGGLFTLYLLFNLGLAGSLWPNTFYAKQAEYAVLLQQPFLARLANEPLQLLTGAGIFLLPGLILALVSATRRRDWGVLAIATWMAGFLVLYAWRLPATYQHGRYIMPVMPVYFLLGLAGMAEFLLLRGLRGRWVLATSWKLATGLALMLFWGRGAFAYASDVAFIESEMVTTARWVAANIPSEALVAAHDIGALGYFGDRDLLDLAGLVSPDVIPFIRDEARLADYLDEQDVNYLVTFPDWYPSLTSGLIPVFSTGAPYAPSAGETNMAVYQWPGP
ncbi:MAG: hypothetical protein AB1531_04325 [Chloroflexota bacterium]